MSSLSGGAIAGICIGSFVFAYILLAIVAVRVFPIRSRAETIQRLKERFPYSLKHISHRGGSLNGPENTLFAFRRAVDEGKTSMLEMDVNISADGVAVVSHDLSLERICDEPFNRKAVADLVVGDNPDATLPQLKRRIPMHFTSATKGNFFDADNIKTEVPRDRTTRLPTLEEVFDAFPNTPIHLDVKAKSDKLAHDVIDMIERYGREHLTVVGSMSNNVEAIRQAKSMPSVRERIEKGKLVGSIGGAEGNYHKRKTESTGSDRKKTIRTFASFRQVLLTYVFFYLGILPFIPLDFDLFSIPGPTGSRKQQFSNYLGERKAALAFFLAKSPALWRHLQRRGIGVVVWVLNDEEEFKEGAKWPVNGIMTDDAIGLRDFFESGHFENENEVGGLVTWD